MKTVELLPSKVGDNTVLSLEIEKCNDYSERKYTQVSGSARLS
nr:MAG TPA: hypothetical protein [Caudoviricetes sp.]